MGSEKVPKPRSVNLLRDIIALPHTLRLFPAIGCGIIYSAFVMKEYGYFVEAVELVLMEHPELAIALVFAVLPLLTFDAYVRSVPEDANEEGGHWAVELMYAYFSTVLFISGLKNVPLINQFWVGAATYSCLTALLPIYAVSVICRKSKLRENKAQATAKFQDN